MRYDADDYPGGKIMFNQTHPELEPGEMFYTNASVKYMRKNFAGSMNNFRMGVRAYMENGVEFNNYGNTGDDVVVPWFRLEDRDRPLVKKLLQID